MRLSHNTVAAFAALLAAPALAQSGGNWGPPTSEDAWRPAPQRGSDSLTVQNERLLEGFRQVLADNPDSEIARLQVWTLEQTLDCDRRVHRIPTECEHNDLFQPVAADRLDEAIAGVRNYIVQRKEGFEDDPMTYGNICEPSASGAPVYGRITVSDVQCDQRVIGDHGAGYCMIEKTWHCAEAVPQP